MQHPLVIKFGGTSVGGGAEFVRAAGIVAEAAHDRPVTVVVSAMSGATDVLLRFADLTMRRRNSRTPIGPDREGSIAEFHRTLLDRHLRAASQAVSEDRLPKVEARVRELLTSLIEAIEAQVEDRAARRAEIAVYGERLSAEILAATIASQGTPAAVAAEDPIATDSNFSEAEVDVSETESRFSRLLSPLLDEGIVVVVPGYGGRSPEGLQTTLGRGGSDLSATVLGRALGSEEVWIMTDVDGVLEADPRLVPDAALMPQLSYGEAGIFAGLGAKVLHYKTMEPASEAGLDVLVRNTFNLACSGTRVSEQESGPGLRCVALRRGLSMEIPCSQGRERAVASVVCIGKPEDGDVSRGARRLREADIAVLHSGVAAAGLVFFVSAEEGERALRVLHAGLISSSIPVGEEVA